MVPSSDKGTPQNLRPWKISEGKFLVWKLAARGGMSKTSEGHYVRYQITNQPLRYMINILINIVKIN